MNDFTIRSNQALNDAVNSANTPQELREKMLAELASQGQIVRMRGDEYDNRVIRQPQTPGAPLPVSGFRYEKEVKFHPESGKRTLIIRANSKEDLDALERQVTGQ
jgi:hypothetical protein